MSTKDYPKKNLSHDNYHTDTWLLKMFPGQHWHDPCPFNPDWEKDGLLYPWKSRTFVNPPYSNPLPWIRKAIRENQEHGHTIALLLKHDSSTKWYAELHQAGAHFLMIQGRLKHQTKKGAAFPSLLAILEGDTRY